LPNNFAVLLTFLSQNVSLATNQHIKMISEDAPKKSALPPEIYITF